MAAIAAITIMIVGLVRKVALSLGTITAKIHSIKPGTCRPSNITMDASCAAISSMKVDPIRMVALSFAAIANEINSHLEHKGQAEVMHFNIN